MEIAIHTIDTRKGTIEYICDELRKLIHLHPGKEGKINLSLDLARPEYISVFMHEDEGGPYFSCSWNVYKKHYVYSNISLDIVQMVKDVTRMYDDIAEQIKDEAEKTAFEDRCYKLYQLEWMMSHGYSLDDLYKVMLKYEQDMFDPEDFGDGEYGHGHEFDASDLERAATQARDMFLFEDGFGSGHLFACKEEFLDTEYQDTAYMKWLLETQVDDEADKLKKLYAKYSGKSLSYVPELKVHTDAGTLNAYKCTDPNHPGICVLLQPKGIDAEIDVTLAESDGKNINILNWGDATTEESTHRETLRWEDIESVLKPKALTKEELIPIILDEWKRFTYYDGENINADDIEVKDIPTDLIDEIAFRCDGLETDDITQNIRACLEYAKEKGVRELIKEMDDCNIWDYIR